MNNLKDKAIEDILKFLKNYSGEEDEHGIIKTQLGNFISQLVNDTVRETKKTIKRKLEPLLEPGGGCGHQFYDQHFKQEDVLKVLK